MEGEKQSGSSSSFTSDLFGAKDSGSSSSSGIFDSIFPPKALEAESVRFSETEKKNNTGNQSWSAKNGSPGEKAQGVMMSSNGKTSYYEEKAQPFHYSSSIYYGGQDVYQPQNTENPRPTTLKKDGGEDDLGSASRGNWWQGSLYY